MAGRKKDDQVADVTATGTICFFPLGCQRRTIKHVPGAYGNQPVVNCPDRTEYPKR